MKIINVRIWILICIMTINSFADGQTNDELILKTVEEKIEYYYTAIYQMGNDSIKVLYFKEEINKKIIPRSLLLDQLDTLERSNFITWYIEDSDSYGHDLTIPQLKQYIGYNDSVDVLIINDQKSRLKQLNFENNNSLNYPNLIMRYYYQLKNG